ELPALSCGAPGPSFRLGPPKPGGGAMHCLSIFLRGRTAFASGVFLSILAMASTGVTGGGGRSARESAKSGRRPARIELHREGRDETREGPGDAAEWWHAQRAFPASELPDTLYLTGYEEWRAVTQPMARA